ncbi:dol-P-Man:Man(6)GlcNAc(2)-PP-Dol alpha-1,2-mannosyltransferase-like isoform X1 [Magnolia sinica]|uniref:dol-P-Man:Man(6)GlcNAc(2)-PP-Dol alpha-1,2-mannosyltransferase-like isoform X1 n=1 Tax=Magnolia sinica TaxID=86752 RepID=UPI00265A9CC0|nr:dol-P-Man:Man(6)GlcNAc(2)-PP-Dol alpha-1,2-mannosyltransferase-like isoform X1 [Magnolia sinica]
MSWKLPFFALVTLRYMSATSNIIHNCNEVFNYWEPLHFLLFKSGFQTWEYRAGFYRWENHSPLSGVNKGTSGGLAISFSGCDGNQTSADTSVSGCFF